MALCLMTVWLLAHEPSTLAVRDTGWLVWLPEPVAVMGPGVESHPSAAGLVGHSSLEKISLVAILFAILLVFDAVECTVELVGEIEVNGDTATYSFVGVGVGITGYICKLDGDILPDCRPTIKFC